MANQIQKKFIKDNAVDGDKILLGEGQDLRRIVGGIEVNVIADLESDITAENTRATGVESALQGEIDQVELDLASEITRATGAESALQGEVDAVETGLANEITRASNAESALQTELDGTQLDLANEITRATGAESALQSEIDAEELARTNADSALQSDINAEIVRATNAENALDARIDSLESLDPVEYKGIYNASTNTPALADGVGNNGDVYHVAVAGSHDFGSGAIEFAVGDKVVYAGFSLKWEKWDMTDQVASVNGQMGPVVLDADDVLMLDGVTTIESKLNSLQTELDAEELARANEDIAINAKVDALKTTVLGQVYYVNKSGNDTTGVGSDLAPYASIKKVLEVAPIGSAINIAVGTYIEADDFEFKAGYNYIGMGGSFPTIVRHTTTATPIKLQKGATSLTTVMKDLSITSPFEMSQLNLGVGGFLDLVDVHFASTFKSDNTGNASALTVRARDCRFNGDVSNKGPVNHQMYGCTLGLNVNMGDITLPVSQGSNIFSACVASLNATLRLYGTSATLIGSSFDNVVIDTLGVASRRFTYDVSSLSFADAIITGSPIIYRLSKAQSLSYTPSVAGNWNVSPIEAKAALDELASRVKAVETDAGEFAEIKITVTALDLSNGYVDLNHDAIQSSIVAHVSRLAIFLNDDYLLSVVASKTRVTFTGDLIAPSQEALAVGDVLRFKYKY